MTFMIRPLTMTIAGKPYVSSPTTFSLFGIRMTHAAGKHGINVSGITGTTAKTDQRHQLRQAAYMTGASADARQSTPFVLTQLAQDANAWLKLRDGVTPNGPRFQVMPGYTIPRSGSTSTHRIAQHSTWGVTHFAEHLFGRLRRGVIAHDGNDTSVFLASEPAPAHLPQPWLVQVTYENPLYSIAALQSFHPNGDVSDFVATARIALNSATSNVLCNMFKNGGIDQPVRAIHDVDEAQHARDWSAWLAGGSAPSSHTHFLEEPTHNTWVSGNNLFLSRAASFIDSTQRVARDDPRALMSNESLGLQIDSVAALFFAAAFEVRNAGL